MRSGSYGAYHLDSRQVDREGLRLRLRGTCAAVEQEWPAPELGIPAAVLVGVVEHPQGPSVILTRRNEYLENHAGQISLPGGRIEPGDAGPADAALREAFEEIGLTSDRVELLGCLSPHTTVTGFRVYPFVGWVYDPGELVIDHREVAEVMEVPLDFILDPANHRRDSLVADGVRHHFYVIDYAGQRIWGATAGILVSLARLLTSTEEEMDRAEG